MHTRFNFAGGIAFVAAAFFLSSCSQKPEDVAVEAYMAASDGRCDDFKEAFTQEAQAQAGPKIMMYCEMLAKQALVSGNKTKSPPEVEVEGPSPDGAMLVKIYPSKANISYLRFIVDRQEGSWKISARSFGQR